jgi:hypothetical protein
MNEQATPAQLLWPYISNSVRMLQPRCTQEPCMSSIRKSGRCGAVGAFLRCCPSYGSFRREQFSENRTGLRSFLALRRACSPQLRVARVSRLIGNSDSTAKRRGWQVDLCGSRGQGGILEKTLTGKGRGLSHERKRSKRSKNVPNAQNATPIGAAFRGPALATGLPKHCGRWFLSTVPTADYPSRFIPF